MVLLIVILYPCWAMFVIVGFPLIPINWNEAVVCVGPVAPAPPADVGNN
jgi:hypothetical protein